MVDDAIGPTGELAANVPALASSAGPESVLVRYGLTGWDAVGLVVTLLLVVAFAPPLLFDGWTPRIVVVLAVGPLGLICLAGLASERDRSALLLVGALAWTVGISVTSGAARSALLGSVGRDLSALIVVASASLWSIGRRLSPNGRQALPVVFVGACTFNAVFGVLQVVGTVEHGSLALYYGRPTGLSINPVYFGALSAAALSVAVDQWGIGNQRRWTGPMVLLGVAVTLSGSRVALLAAVAVLALRLSTRRTRETLIGVGVAALSLIAGVAVDRMAGAGYNAADRLVGEAGGGGRAQVWRYAIEGVADRPLVGYGFGRFRPAVQSRFSIDFVRLNAPDDLSQAWFDAHNVVIALLVAVGVFGAALFLAWAGLWTLRVRGPLTWALLAIAFHWMLQPVSLVTLPVVMLLFGASGSEDHRPRAVARSVVASCAIVGGLLGCAALIGDIVLKRASSSSNADMAEAAAIIYLRDPVVSDVVAQVVRVEAASPTATDAEMIWHRRAADAEPDRPYWWVVLAGAQISRGDLDDAEVSVAKALDLQPTNVRAWLTEAILAIKRDDEARLLVAFDRLCDLGQPECDIDPLTLLESESP